MLQPSFGDFFRPPEATAPGSLPEPTWNAADATATISQSPSPPAQSHPKTHQRGSKIGEIRMTGGNDEMDEIN